MTDAAAIDGLRVEPLGAVYRIVIDRPARRNALTPEITRRIAEQIEAAAATEARVVLLSGAGGHFSAGLDLQWLASLGGVPDERTLRAGLGDFQAAVLAVVQSPLPVIAVVQGTAAGFGLDLALACDMRIAGESARFTSAFARMALVPDGGSTFTLARLVGPGRAFGLLTTGETVDAAAGAAMGLVDAVHPDGQLDEAVTAVVTAIAAGAGTSVSAIKQLTRDRDLGALEQALAAEGAAQLRALQSSEFMDRLAAFQQRSARSGG